MALLSYRRGFDPVDALIRLQQQLDDVSRSPASVDMGVSGRGVYPPVNVFRDTDGLAIRFEVPGFAPEDLSIESRGQTLVVSGKPSAVPRAEGSYHRRERPLNEFSRSLALPADVEVTRAQARCNNGILTVRVPLREEVKPREIKVSAG